MDEGAWDSSTHLRAIFGDESQTTPIDFNEINATNLSSTTLSLLSQPLAFRHLQNQLSDQSEGYVPEESVGITGTFNLPQGADPDPPPLSPDLPLSDSGSVGYELGTQATQPFQSFIVEYGTYSSGSSASRHQELRLPIVQGGQDKVICTWPGCSKVVNEDNHFRHVNEAHLRKVRDVCTGCGRAFPRMYMKKKHICRGLFKRRSMKLT
ncbi:hypothetical protein K503DRAFT_776442 [Rhizopogon vinicolor AM-OR11-026]|uniref:Uncharacterized protein n=1 Tax=Rhizopogon vinicolor AM-OR11-026 TaxID=1314800 RepID=A0A1B7MJ86_9AGAM|nr:hypothetical protein K503DRAFT_776442 [Rhizopogon vinicolor AM-OR11-026]